MSRKKQIDRWCRKRARLYKKRDRQTFEARDATSAEIDALTRKIAAAEMPRLARKFFPADKNAARDAENYEELNDEFISEETTK